VTGTVADLAVNVNVPTGASTPPPAKSSETSPWTRPAPRTRCGERGVALLRITGGNGCGNADQKPLDLLVRGHESPRPQGCDYDAYLPDPLAGWQLALPADLVADLSDAEAAIRRLNATGKSHVSLEGLARFLLRAESVASSKIEGLEAGPRRLLDAEVVLAQGGDAADRIAVEVLAHVAAMEAAVELGSSPDIITLDAR